MTGQERNEQSLTALFSANIKDMEYYVDVSDDYGKLKQEYFYTEEDAIDFANKKNNIQGLYAKVYDKFGNQIESSRRPIKSSVRMIRHPSIQTYLPFTQYNGSPYHFNGIQINDWGVRLEGSAGGSYAAESTNIDIYNDGTVSVYDTKHHLDNTKYYNLELIHDFLKFFRENVDVMSYLDKPTATGMVSLSSADTYKIKEWADAHKFNE